MSNTAWFRRGLLLLLVAGATVLHPALGVERAGDAAFANALRDRTQVARGLERDLLALIAGAGDENGFELYRTYNRLIGAWFQVELAQSLLARAVAVAAAAEEAQARINLRDQARFALWDLAEAVAQLDQDAPDASGRELVELHGMIRALLLDTRAVIGHLGADQCLHAHCVESP